MKKAFVLISIIVIAIIFTACSVSNNSDFSNKTTVGAENNSKIVPSSELVNLYGKTHYIYEFKNEEVVFTDECYDPDSVDKDTWSVAWYEDENTAEIKNAQLVIEANEKEIYNNPIKINKIKNENDYIHGWNHYVLINEIFSAKCDKNSEPSAFIRLVDNNGVEYKVLLNSDTIMSDNDASNNIIITDKNATYSYWDVN